MSGRPTRRQATGPIRPQRPTKRSSATGRMARAAAGPLGDTPGASSPSDGMAEGGASDGDRQRPDHARSLRMAVYAVAGVALFAAAFIVLVLVLNQLPLR